VFVRQAILYDLFIKQLLCGNDEFSLFGIDKKWKVKDRPSIEWIFYFKNITDNDIKYILMHESFYFYKIVWQFSDECCSHFFICKNDDKRN